MCIIVPYVIISTEQDQKKDPDHGFQLMKLDIQSVSRDECIYVLIFTHDVSKVTPTAINTLRLRDKSGRESSACVDPLF